MNILCLCVSLCEQVPSRWRALWDCDSEDGGSLVRFNRSRSVDINLKIVFVFIVWIFCFCSFGLRFKHIIQRLNDFSAEISSIIVYCEFAVVFVCRCDGDKARGTGVPEYNDWHWLWHVDAEVSSCSSSIKTDWFKTKVTYWWVILTKTNETLWQ